MMDPCDDLGPRIVEHGFFLTNHLHYVRRSGQLLHAKIHLLSKRLQPNVHYVYHVSTFCPMIEKGGD
jgi:hypothetical protein